MKVWVGKNRNGKWKAFLDYEKASKFNHLIESELPIVHDKVYIIKVYYGFDYNYGSLLNPICDDVRFSNEIFHSVSALKKSPVWKVREELVKKEPEKYHVTPFSIASDHYGSPFTYGDVMEGMFNMEIIGVRVYR